jgi:ABC-type uncharacterized transport system substrate-binding protein
VPVGSVRSRLDWASTTVALAMSDIANTTMPKIFLIVELLSLLFPRQRLNLLDPRLRQRKRAYGSSVDLPCWPGHSTAKRALKGALVPAAAVIAVLVNPKNQATDAETRELKEAARALGLQLHVLNASGDRDIELAFADLARQRAGALLAATDALLNARYDQLAALAGRNAVPAIHQTREFAAAGGLMIYGADIADAWRQAGSYVGRILKGAKPADLPVVQSSKFELVINTQTATMLGLTVPPSLFAIADEVIE